MKRILLIWLVTLSFGTIRANFLPKNYNCIKPLITIVPINNLNDYNIPFRVNPYCAYPFWKVKAVPSPQNKLAILISRKFKIERDLNTKI